MINFFKNLLFLQFTIITVFSSCKNGGGTYILSKEDSINKSLNTNNGILIEPPKVKYAINTFLIDSNSFVYFYSFQEPKKNSGVSDDPEPDTIGLMPNYIFRIPKGMERSFFDENVQKQAGQQAYKSVIIALFKDSTKNEFLQYLLKLSKDKSNKLSLQLRMALPEERTVLKYKLNGVYYDLKTK